MNERGDAHILATGLATITSGTVTAIVGATEGADLSGIALIIVALGSLITAVGGVIVAIMVNRVHKEVKTLNSLTVGQASDATESRRVEAIPYDDRTRKEQHHLDETPEPGPAQGPPR